MVRRPASIALLTVFLLAACGGESPETPIDEAAESEGNTLLYSGPADLEGDASVAFMLPGVYANVFPLDLSGRRPSNPLNVPADIARRLRSMTPEIRMWGLPPPRVGIAIERRGWQQGDVTRAGTCHIYFDYRVDLKEVRAGANGKFGVTSNPVRWVKVFPPPNGQTGLYVLIVTEVGINLDRVGQQFTETNASIVAERQRAGQTVTTTISRAFIVEHELAHAEQIRKAFYDALQARMQADQLCNPTRPINQHAARLTNTDFPAAWQALQNSGAGGGHNHANYPNTPVETEARRVAWRLVP